MEYNGENIKEMLQDAALKDGVTILRALLGQDPLLLHRPSNVHPLHISSRLGHLQFTEELLRINPSLAEELDPIDKSSPLHLASGNGHVDIVKALVSANACMCVAHDVHGRNLAHVAAMKGHVLVLEELIRALPTAARERVGGGGESIMHLCVTFNQIEALSLVASEAGAYAKMLLNASHATDGDANTILHIAVADKRLEIVHFLVKDNRVKRNTQNGNGLTAKDLYVQDNKGRNKNPILRFTLEQANVLRSKEIKEEKKKQQKENRFDWVENQGSALMVVASLVATMAFQAGLTPPPLLHKNLSSDYNEFVLFNTIGLLSSMSSIILLISGLPGRRFFMILVMVMMWVAVTTMTYAYGISIEQFREAAGTSVHENEGSRVHLFSFLVWCFVMALLLLGHLFTCPRRLNSIFMNMLVESG